MIYTKHILQNHWSHTLQEVKSFAINVGVDHSIQASIVVQPLLLMGGGFLISFFRTFFHSFRSCSFFSTSMNLEMEGMVLWSRITIRTSSNYLQCFYPLQSINCENFRSDSDIIHFEEIFHYPRNCHQNESHLSHHSIYPLVRFFASTGWRLWSYTG